jgi:uncharacterized membrane protein
MRIDLSDLERVDSIADALNRLFWCLVAVAFLAAILGSAGTGLLVLILAAAAFVVRVGLEDFARSRREPSAAAEPQIRIHRTAGAKRAKRQAPRQTRPRRPVAR